MLACRALHAAHDLQSARAANHGTLPYGPGLLLTLDARAQLHASPAEGQRLLGSQVHAAGSGCVVDHRHADVALLPPVVSPAAMGAREQ